MAELFSIPACEPFLPVLARGLLERLGAGLADALILLPSRRTCVALREALLEESDGGPLLLPRLQPVAEIEDEPLLDVSDADRPPPLPPFRRLLTLTRLVLARGGTTQEQAVRLAYELERFLDEIDTERVDRRRLKDLVPEAFALHWQEVLGFLRIIIDAWPAHLAEIGGTDPAVARNALLEQTATRWRERPPGFPVITAGLTATVPAVRDLLAVIATLPDSLIVLPGVDTSLDEPMTDCVRRTPGHPQHGLVELLDALERGPSSVATWPVARAKPAQHARERLLSGVLRPAEASLPDITLESEALAALSLLEAPNLAGEAQALALRMRGALEQPGRRIALITSDRTLARRVAIELRRWDIEVDDSAGLPLDQTPSGSFLLHCAHLLFEDAGPSRLLAALKHPLARGSEERAAFRRKVRRLEVTALRGPRSEGGLSGLASKLAEGAPELCSWLETLAAAVDTRRIVGEVGLRAALERLIAFSEWLARDESGDSSGLWAQESGIAASRFMDELLAASDAAPPFDAAALPPALAHLMASRAVRPAASRHPRLVIWGQLEQRLQQPDLVLIGGLTEDVWPKPPEPSPWLNRHLRQQLGLPPETLRIGIAAHDFMNAALAPEVVLSWSREDADGRPRTPSRWLTRLRAALGSEDEDEVPRLRRADELLAWAHGLDRPAGPPQPAARPVPKPPLKARPRRLAATDIERLVKDPYAFYARNILGLRPLEPLDSDPAAAERGLIIHAILEEFVRAWPRALPADPQATLLSIGQAAFERYDRHPHVRALWWPRFVAIAAWFIEEEQRRRAMLEQVWVEATGSLTMQGPNGPFEIRARADRLEIGNDASTAIVDYKTGTPPSRNEVRHGRTPQLTVTGAILAAGGFAMTDADRPVQLEYWEVKGGSPAGAVMRPAGQENEVARLIEEARAGLEALLAWYDEPDHGYPAIPRPEVARAQGDYDHLARIAEWRGT